MCDRFGIINKGRLIASGTMEQLRSGSASESSSLEDIFLQLTDTGEQADVVKLLYGEAER
jgi:ABC-2 type transport system ATP-binding protein